MFGRNSLLLSQMAEYLNEDIDIYPVQYPMREKRAKDPMPDSITELAQQFCDECIELIREKEFAFLGHCCRQSGGI